MEMGMDSSSNRDVPIPTDKVGLIHVDMSSAQIGQTGDQSIPTPTKQQLLELLQNTQHVRIHSLDDHNRQMVSGEINQLDNGDLKTIGDIARTLKREPFDKAAMDKILEPYNCFPERLRNLLNPVDLLLQRENMDLFRTSPDRHTFGVEGGYDNYPTDKSSYTFSIHHDREVPFYTFKINMACG
jgi:hypothetical protein